MTGIMIAALGGAAIGVERQWSGHASGSDARFGGVRTFTLLGGLAGLAGWLSTIDHGGVAIALIAGAVGLVIAGYVTASRRDVDATTEAAGLVVIGAGLPPVSDRSRSQARSSPSRRCCSSRKRSCMRWSDG